jgi:subtilase family serine protease
VFLKPRDPAALAAAVAAVSDPSSSEYRDYLQAGTFTSLYGPLPSTITSVRTTLRSEGLNPGPTSSDGLIIPVTSTAKKAETAFGTTLENYWVDGHVAFANSTALTLPTSIAPKVQGVVGLDELNTPVPLGLSSASGDPSARSSSSPALFAPTSDTDTQDAEVTRPHASGPAACSAVKQAATDYSSYTAPQLASTYGFTNAYSSGDLGSGETIGLYELEPYESSDISAYQSCYGTNTSVTNVLVDGGAGSGSGSGEATLDIEDVIGLAPDANILVYEGPDTGTGSIDLYSQMVTADKAKIISTSWGLCEQENGSADAQEENTLFAEAALQGQTVLAAAGDDGSEDCYDSSTPSNTSELNVDDPGSQPYVTDVGGTSLSLTPRSETVWNEGDQGGAGGGGISTFWPMPSWQTGTGVLNSFSSGAPCKATSGDCREVPDVSALADPDAGYMIYLQGSWSGYGGTSAAAPLWAAVIAVSSEVCGSALGFVNPTLYSLAASHPSDFNDITSGDNDMTRTHSGAYPATAGYDMASGLGSPAASLFTGFCSSALSPTVTSVAANSGPAYGGNTVTLTGTNFVAGSTGVRFGTTTSPSVTVTSSTSASAIVPAGSTGSVTVTVTTSGGTSSPSGPSYTYTATPAYASPSSPLSYTPLSPTRICDTRTGNTTPCTGKTLAPGAVLNVQVSGEGGVPTGSPAATMNVTAIGQAGGYLSVWPTGDQLNTVSNVNFAAGAAIPNLVTSPLSSSGQVSIYNGSASPTDVILDVQGAFGTTGSTYTPVTPYRVCDTRSGNTTACSGKTVSAGNTLSVQITGVTDPNGSPVPSSATAVALSVTEATSSAGGYLSVWSGSGSAPTVSNLNFSANQVTANLVVVPLSSSGGVAIKNASGNTDVAVDVEGYYAATGGDTYMPISPTRICDTRGGNSTTCSGDPPKSGATLTVGVAGSAGVPSAAKAVTLNVTAISPTAAGYLTAWSGTGAPPLSSNVNFAIGQVVATLATTPVSSAGAVGLFNASGTTNIAVDVEGYWE